MRILIFLIPFISFQSICFGQNNNEVFFNYNMENSRFPAGMVMENFSEEPNGIIWMGSRNGLYRFDGIEFKNFSKNIFDSAQANASHISSQYLKDDLLYAGTYSSGFFILNLKTLKAKHIFLIDSSTGNNFTVGFIYDDGSDSLWIGTSKEAILKMHKKNFGKSVFKLSSSNKEIPKRFPLFKKITPALNNTQYFWALHEKGVWLINKENGNYKIFDDVFGNSAQLEGREMDFTDMQLSSDSIAWITNFNKGLLKWNYVLNETEIFHPNFKTQLQKNIGFNNFTQKSADEFFISSSGFGLLSFNTTTKTFEKYTNEPGKFLSIPPGGSRVLYKDKKGALWISFFNEIAYRHPNYQVAKKIKVPPAYKNLRIVYLNALDSQNLFASLENDKGSLVYNILNKSWSNLITFPDEEGKPVNSRVYYANKINNDWIFKPALPQFYKLEKEPLKFSAFTPLPSKELFKNYKINGIAFNHNKIIYTGNENVLIFNKIEKEWQLHKNDKHPDSLHAKNLRTPLTDKYGNVWMQSLTGLSVYENSKNSFTEISSRTNKDYYGLQYITDLLLNKEGTLAIAATKENGVFVFNTQKRSLVKIYNTENLLPQNDIYKIALSNADSILWVAAYQSITRINLNTNQSETYNDKNSSLDLKQGFISFSVTEEGQVFAGDTLLYSFTANNIRVTKFQPFISSYRIKNEWFPGNSFIKLRKEDSFVELFVGTGNYADKAHEKIYYAVDNDENWNEAENGKIILTSLKNGLTNLKIKAVNNGIIATEGITTLKINRAKYFYQTWWFALATIIIAVGLLLFIFKRKIKMVRLREREKAENEIKISELEMASLRSQMNPHFLFNSLSSLRYLVMTNDSKKATKFIVKLSKLLRRILNHSQEQTILLQDELEALELYLEIESLRFENGFTYSIDVADVEDLFHIKIPPLLLQPIVENAIKHGLVNSELTEKWVEIKVRQLPKESIEITIADNGIGRNKAAGLKKYNAANSMGNSLTAQRILLFNKTHKAKLSCMVNDLTADKENPGTEVKIIYRETV